MTPQDIHASIRRLSVSLMPAIIRLHEGDDVGTRRIEKLNERKPLADFFETVALFTVKYTATPSHARLFRSIIADEAAADAFDLIRELGPRAFASWPQNATDRRVFSDAMRRAKALIDMDVDHATARLREQGQPANDGG